MLKSLILNLLYLIHFKCYSQLFWEKFIRDHYHHEFYLQFFQFLRFPFKFRGQIALFIHHIHPVIHTYFLNLSNYPLLFQFQFLLIILWQLHPKNFQIHPSYQQELPIEINLKELWIILPKSFKFYLVLLKLQLHYL